MNSGLFRGNQGNSSRPFLAKGCLQFVCLFFFFPLLCDLQEGLNFHFWWYQRGSFSPHKDMLLNGSRLSCEELQKAVAALSAFHFPFLKYPRNLITRQAWVSQSTQK